jgi:hypothetical protein
MVLLIGVFDSREESVTLHEFYLNENFKLLINFNEVQTYSLKIIC